MPTDLLVILMAGIFLIALLYSAVGHAGASGYIAVMSLLSLPPETIKPVALSLNIVVASITTWQFWRAGHYQWPLFWPFALLAVPLAYLGGAMHLPGNLLKALLGLVLLYSAARLFFRQSIDATPTAPPKLLAIACGGGIGLLSGLTGTGGGIFLTPLLLQARWARIKTAAAVSAPFILLNSAAGLLGNLKSTGNFPAFSLALLVAALLGGSTGSYLGSRRFDTGMIRTFLALVLIIAGSKLLLGG